VENIYRLDLTKAEFEEIVSYLPNLSQKLKLIKKSPKKTLSSQKATEFRTKTVKRKIQNAINILKFEDKPITAYSVAKTADIAYVTAKKYLQQING
jgi:response regulator of citrate/malate metabolism